MEEHKKRVKYPSSGKVSIASLPAYPIVTQFATTNITDANMRRTTRYDKISEPNTEYNNCYEYVEPENTSWLAMSLNLG